jgi:hypothetical protein
MHSLNLNFQGVHSSTELSHKKLKGSSLHAIKKQNINKWKDTQSIKVKKVGKSLDGFVLKSVPLDLSHYKIAREQTKSLVSQTSTSDTLDKDKQVVKKFSEFIQEEQQGQNIQQLSQNLKHLKLTVDENAEIQLLEPSNTLKEGEYIYDDSIKIVKFLGEGAQARLYIGHIEEIDKLVAIKRYSVNKMDQNLAEKIGQECDMLKQLDNDNIIKYFDVELNYNDYEVI